MEKLQPHQVTQVDDLASSIFIDSICILNKTIKFTPGFINRDSVGMVRILQQYLIDNNIDAILEYIKNTHYNGNFIPDFATR
jgi:hypothetical protein